MSSCVDHVRDLEIRASYFIVGVDLVFIKTLLKCNIPSTHTLDQLEGHQVPAKLFCSIYMKREPKQHMHANIIWWVKFEFGTCDNLSPGNMSNDSKEADHGGKKKLLWKNRDYKRT